MSTISRSRWAAIGAAVAVTLGAGGVGISQATTDSADGPVAAFFPIEPCRLAENTSIGEDASITLDGWGESGGCVLPEGTSALAVNVTAVDATQQTNLRFYASGAPIPATAGLNPTPGAPPTPNAINVVLNATDGQFSIYNRFGTVGVFVDVMGYFDDHTHDDRYYTETEVDAAMAAATPVLTDLSYTSSVVTAPTDAWQLMQTIGTFDKRSADTTVRLDWSAHHSYSDAVDGSVYCQYQLRIDGGTLIGDTTLGADANLDGGDAVVWSKFEHISTYGLFRGLTTGEHTVAIYVRGTATGCTLNPGTFLQQLTATEFTEAALPDS